MERMREQLTARLEQLRQEYEAGQKVLADLAARQREVQQTVLRIEGAMQVLEELLAPADGSAPAPPSEPAPAVDPAAMGN
jgi:prefoldin subunit 5